MKIQRIKLKNFKSFFNETEINFEDLEGLYKISGQIGSGKTTIGEAIIYGLYGTISGKTNTALISWGEKHGLVELWCTSRGKQLYIRRELNSYGQSPMTVEADGEPIVFTNKRNAQAQLESDFLDTPRTTMELLCIISFNNFKSLSTLNAKDTKLFLDQVLGFDVLTSYIDACKEERSSLSTELLQARANISAINGQIDRMTSYKFIDGDPEVIKQELTQLRLDIKNKETESKQTLDPIRTKRTSLSTQLTEVKTLGMAKRKEIDFIKRGTCPTCGAPIDQSQLELKERERENLSRQYKDISAQITDLDAHISQLSTELTNYIAEKKQLVKSQENELIKLNEQSKHTEVNQKEIAKLKRETKKLQKRADEISEEISKYDQLIQILQVQIRAKVLESFIPAINSKIKELSGMLNMSYVPEFDSMFKCSIVTGGTEQVPTSSLSTGQLKMVDVVIILAILGSLISKVNSNIIFLDELFSNIDRDTASDLIAVLRASLPADSSIFVVSHQTMDESLFDGEIKMHLEPTDNDFNRTSMTIIKV